MYFSYHYPNYLMSKKELFLIYIGTGTRRIVISISVDNIGISKESATICKTSSWKHPEKISNNRLTMANINKYNIYSFLNHKKQKKKITKFGKIGKIHSRKKKHHFLSQKSTGRRNHNFLHITEKSAMLSTLISIT